MPTLDASSGSTNLDLTIGALEIGLLAATLLQGLLVSQVYVYFRSFPRDRLHLKIAVGLILSLECAHIIAAANTVYYAAVTTYGQLEVIYTIVKIPSFPTMILLASLSDLIVRAIYVWRLHGFCRNTWISGACSATVILSAAISFALFGILLKQNITAFSNVPEGWNWLLTSHLTCNILSDVAIAGFLVFYLNRSKSGMERSNTIINILILWTIETGLLTSLAAIIELILFFATTGNFVYIALYTVVPKMYSNSLLALLNGRQTLRNVSETHAGSSHSEGMQLMTVSEVVFAGRGKSAFGDEES